MTAAAAEFVGIDVRPPYIAAIAPGDLFADPAYQRDLDDGRVQRMAADFDRRLLGVLEVSARPDGRYAILDGQHRHALVQAVHADRAAPSLVCQVYEGLSIDDEARLFFEINVSRKSLTWWGRWKARRVAGDPGVLLIDQVLANHGLQVHPAAADGNVRAVVALETIVNDLGDVQLLDNVFTVLVSAFGRTPDAFDNAVMQGLAYVLAYYELSGPDAEIDVDRLVVQLREVPPRQLRARAASMREAHRGTLPRLCAAVIIDRYNSGRGRRVEDFFTRVPALSQRRGKRYTATHPRVAIESSEAGPGTVKAAPGADVTSAGTVTRLAAPAADALGSATAPTVPASDQPAPAAPAPHRAAPGRATPHPTVAMCLCGHTKRRHDEQDGCLALDGDCPCADFAPAENGPQR